MQIETPAVSASAGKLKLLAGAQDRLKGECLQFAFFNLHFSMLF
jgi:hypothetical protein